MSHLDLYSKDIFQDDLVTVIDSEISTKGLLHHHLSTFNEFTSTGIKQIVENLFSVKKSIKNMRDNTDEDRSIDTISFNVTFTNVEVTNPVTMSYKSGKLYELTPSLARTNNLTYTAPMKVSAHIKAEAYLHGSDIPKVRTEEVENFRIASIPIMVRSKLCNTYGLTKTALRAHEEDPRDEGGYFVIGGSEWVVNNIESRKYNEFHVFRNIGHLNEISRGEFISKPGDAFENSKELKLLYLVNGAVTIEITAPHFTNLKIPFYIIFRLFGMSSDKEIMDNIVYGYDNSIVKKMVIILTKAFRLEDSIFKDVQDIRIQPDIIKFMSGVMARHSGGDKAQIEALEQWLQANLLTSLDKHLLPHIGRDRTARHKKLRYLGYLIYKLLLVEQQIIESTDRDSLKNKRINPAGLSYAKVLKTQFNLAIVQAIKKKMTRVFKSMSFSQVPLGQTFKTSIHGPDLERALIQAIVSGDKELTIHNTRITNRLASNQLHRKNQLNVLSVLRTIRTPSSSSSKAAKRSHEMRQVHPSYTGYICVVQSADTGPPVGLIKQMAISASVAPASSSELLKMTLLEDKDIVPLDKIFPEQLYNSQLAKIFVNGDWIGCTIPAYKLVKKYREMRRLSFSSDEKPKIHPLTTIYWDTHINEIHFWVDMGRIIRPLLIVRNNIDDADYFKTKYNPEKGSSRPKGSLRPNGTNFIQDIMLTKDMIQKILKNKQNVDDLHRQGIIEYIAPEEQENCYIASSLDVLRENQYNPLHQYTHCEIPISAMGIVALAAPLCQHDALVRVVYHTNQIKQTAGPFALNWPYRIDKNQFLQYDYEMPIVPTFSNKYIYPIGMNSVVAIACYGGYNQEDSLIFNQAAIDRGMFVGTQFTFIKTELEKDEEFSSPNEANTIDIKSRASYEHLVNGFVQAGTIVHKNDVLIGKRVKLSKPTGQYIYQDKSIMHKSDEPAIVEAVIRARNQEATEFCKIKLRSIREPNIGDKYCRKKGSQVLTYSGWKNIENIEFSDKVATLVNGEKLEYVNPTGIYEFEHDGDMYHIKSQQIDLCVTMNHKMYVKKRDHKKYELIEAENITGKRVRYKKDAVYDKPDEPIYTIYSNNENDPDIDLNMNAWIEFLGIFIADGCLEKRDYRIVLAGIKPRKIKKIKEVCDKLNLNVSSNYRKLYDKTINSAYDKSGVHYIKSRQIYNELIPLNVGAINKYLPKWVFNLNQRQSRILLNALIACDGSYNPQGSACYYTSSKQLANDITQLALHAGWSGTTKMLRPKGSKWKIGKSYGFLNADALVVRIVKTKNNPQVNHGHCHEQNAQTEEIIKYKGNVYCIEVPSHVIYVRENERSPPCWTGNSSRHG